MPERLQGLERLYNGKDILKLLESMKNDLQKVAKSAQIRHILRRCKLFSDQSGEFVEIWPV